MQVKDRVAVVTGSGQGIGAGIARAFGAAGASVVVNDVAGDRVTAVAQELRDLGASAIGVEANVSTTAGAQALVDRTVAEFGRLDILVNNVGIARDRYLTKMSEEEWDDVIRINLKSPFLCCRAAVPHMVERTHGRIINISSRAWLGGAGQANYASSKGGVVSLTRTLALELAKFEITANCVAPALIDTPLFRGLAGDVQERLAKTVPMGRVGTPEDIAQAVLFFASDEASYVTGQILYVCGGRSLGAS